MLNNYMYQCILLQAVPQSQKGILGALRESITCEFSGALKPPVWLPRLVLQLCGENHNQQTEHLVQSLSAASSSSAAAESEQLAPGQELRGKLQALQLNSQAGSIPLAAPSPSEPNSRDLGPGLGGLQPEEPSGRFEEEWAGLKKLLISARSPERRENALLGMGLLLKRAAPSLPAWHSTGSNLQAEFLGVVKQACRPAELPTTRSAGQRALRASGRG